LEILFLGTSCAIPTLDNGSTSFLVRTSGYLILVDASDNPVKSILKAGMNPLELDVVLLTHYHADHLSGYPALISTLNCMGREKDLTVITNEATESKAKDILAIFKLQNNNLNYKVNYTDGLLEAALSVELVSGFHTVPTSMVFFKENSTVVFYTADTVYTPQISEIAKNCSLMIHEATYSRRRTDKLEGHSTAYDAGLSAENAGAKGLYLCHICLNEYPNLKSVIKEARETYTGEIIIPKLFHWYKIH